MKCQKCQTDNREGAKFCGKCRTKLSLICPQCDSENPPDNAFCDQCGFDLTEPKEAPPIDYKQPQSYTPKHLVDKILTNRSSIEGECKLVTVLFADVANYTSMAEKLDPEIVHQIMDGCFNILMNETHKYEGTINQFTGDGIMALFGAPISHEDHAQKACHAALSIQNSIAEYGKKITNDLGINFKMRIGINSGPVVVGAIGDDLRMDYTAIGDTTNLASRLENMTKPGTVLVSGNTYKLARDFFEFQSRDQLKIKGKETPQQAYQLIKPSSIETRLQASSIKGLTKFVGRKKSMVALKEALKKVTTGAGQVVGVVGEAGVGKSRLLLEFRNLLTQRFYTYLEGRCLHFGGSMGYLPFMDILRSYFEIEEGDREPLIKKKMAEKMAKLDKNLESDLPPFMDLISIKVEDEEFIKLGPQQKKERTFESVRNLLIRVSQEKPLILAVEDLHWIDKTSEEFLNYLIGSLSSTNILLILLYRPEYIHQWGSKSYYLKIGLNQLTIQSSADLVQAILEGGEVNPELRELVLSRTSGNPLYIEELTHSLLENGSIQKKDYQFVLSGKDSEILVPDTIQGIIASRMDRLEDNLKRTMQVASVIGRDFAFRILQTITGLRKDLKAHILNLQGLEFIYEKNLFPELEYIFKHALTQEVAYNSLLHKRRKEIHEKIGNAIEQIYPERLEEFYEMLAYHFDQGQVWHRAVEYQVKAGTKARHGYLLQTALDNFNRAKEIIEKHEPDVPWRVRYDLFFEMSGALLDLGQPHYALGEAQIAVNIAHREGATDLKVQAMFSKATAALYGNDSGQMKTTLEEMEPLVADNIESLLGVVTLQTAAFLILLGDLPSALAKEKEMNDLFQRAPNSPFYATAALFIGLSLRWRGDFKKCSETLEPLLPKLRASAPPVSYLESTFFCGLALGEEGLYQKAIRILQEGLEFGLKAGERYSTPKLTNSLGWAYYELCLFDKAIEYNNLALESIRDLLGPGTSNLFEIESQTRINLAENYLMTGDWQKAREYLELVYANAKKPEYYFVRPRWKPRCLLRLGELWLQAGDRDRAESFLSELYEHQWTDKFPYKKYQVRAWRLRSDILSAMGQMEDAESELNRALTLAKQLGNPTLLWKTHQALGNLLLKKGKSEEAKVELQTALKVVQSIAESLTDVALKEGYLQSNPIQELFSKAKGS
jgi:class 3 adenylate cyclase/tetratricopeptide (TPR) repeat protein/ribosomal protein L40E